MTKLSSSSGRNHFSSLQFETRRLCLLRGAMRNLMHSQISVVDSLQYISSSDKRLTLRRCNNRMQVEVSKHTEGSKEKALRPNGLPESLIRYDGVCIS
jgi:hypothetical protein